VDFLHFDYETFSLADLKEVGLDNYAKHPSTGISCMAWALNHEELEVWLPHLGPPPTKFIDALRNPAVMKIAWHSAFEYNITRRVLVPKYLHDEWFVPLEQFRDPIILAHNLSLPGKLEDVANILKMKERKDPRGAVLIKMFCHPVNEKQLLKFKENPAVHMALFGPPLPLFRDHNSHPREFAEYVEYCRQDVRTERDLWYRMVKVPFPEIEWRGWLLDQKINEFGMPGNRQMAEKMLRIAERFIGERQVELKKLTGLENPNSDDQVKEWLSTRGYAWGSLNAKYVTLELDNKESKLTPEARTVLTLRKAARKSSYKKLIRFLSQLSEDDRLRYQFKYMAAPRTGRWAAGKTDDTDSAVQVQNMSRGEKGVKKNLQHAIDLVMAEDYDTICREFMDIPDKKKSVTPVELVITLMRSLFQAKPGKKLNVADLNAIENRKLGWAAGCKAILDVFRTCNKCGYLVEDLIGPFLCPKCGGHKHRCPYLAFGTNLYNKTYAEMLATFESGNEEERQNSKPGVLGGGYGLGGGELYINENKDEVRGGLWGYAKNVCGVDMPQELAHKAVKIFRATYTEVVRLWDDLEEAFKQVLKRGGRIRVGEVTWDKKNHEWIEHPTKGKQCVIEFQRQKIEGGGYMIRMVLPSGRALHYLNATIEEEKRTSKKTGLPYAVQTIYYDGIEHSASEEADGSRKKQKHKWGRVKTYGGKICENAIQAMSRDDLLNGMFEADAMGFQIFGMFHDELATEDNDDMFGLRLEDLIYCMTVVPDWAPGMLLGADGYSGPVYHK
jgi:DNA polymerase